MIEIVDESVEVDGRRLRFANPGKVLWPATGFTKADLLAYHLDLAEVLLTHVRARPLTLGRWPDGVDELGWYQTTCPHPPVWLRTHLVPKQRGEGPGRDYCIVDDAAGLVWVTNLGAVELHPLLSALPDVTCPTAVVFDLDPGADRTMADVAEVALLVRDVLEAVGLRSYPKTSGGWGIHVAAPIERGRGYNDAKAFARAVASRLSADHPERVTDRSRKTERVGKVFIDWSQNDQHKSTVAPYSLRAMPWPSPSTPLTWEEVEAAAAGRIPLRFDADDVRRRLARLGDLHAEVIADGPALPPAASVGPPEGV